MDPMAMDMKFASVKHIRNLERSYLEHALEVLNPMTQWIFQVLAIGGRDYITPKKAIYKWYILPIGGLYATYHLLGEPETTIE